MAIREMVRGAVRGNMRMGQGQQAFWQMDLIRGGLPEGVMFMRASGAGRFNQAGLWEVVGTNVPRFDHDPVTLHPEGVLCEPEAINRLLQNRNLGHSVWVKTNCTATQTAVGLDGVSNSAAVVTATSANGTVLQSLTLASAARVFSVWIKRATGSGAVSLTLDNGATWTAVTVSAGWTRVFITATVTNPVAGIRLATSGDAVAVDLTQLESGSVPTSAIVTAGTSMTRSADVMRVPNMTVMGFNAQEGTLVLEYRLARAVSGSNVRLMQLHDGGANDRLNVSVLSSDGSVDGAGFVGGVSSGLAFSPRAWAPVGQVCRTALAYKANDVALCTNENLSETQTVFPLATMVALGIGHNGYDTGAGFNGHVRGLKYFPTRLAGSQLQSLTVQREGTVDVVVILGQSNADGRCANGSLPSHLASFYSEPRPNLWVYQKPAVREGATVSSGSFADDGAWWNLDKGHSGALGMTHQVIGPESSTVAAQSGALHGVELELGYQYTLANPGRELRVIKAGVGGSSIEGEWKVVSGAADGLWAWFKTHVYEPALADLRALGKVARIIGVFWMQGETDADSGQTTANAYEARLQALVNRLNTELGVVPGRIVIGGLPAIFDTGAQGYGGVVKAAQASVAGANANTVLLATDGTGVDAAYALNADNIHFSASGMSALGSRLWGVVS